MVAREYAFNLQNDVRCGFCPAFILSTFRFTGTWVPCIKLVLITTRKETAHQISECCDLRWYLFSKELLGAHFR